MLVSVNWLNEFVDLSNIEDSQIAHELTMSGLEVEAIEEVKPQFTNIRTVKIEKIDAHPNSDRLHLVTVDTGSGNKTVVCGAQNIQEGQIVPYASVGSKVLDRKTGEQFELTPAVIRGVESQGMLCSADELGVSERNYQEEDGILVLNRIFPDVKLGEKVEDFICFFDSAFAVCSAVGTKSADSIFDFIFFGCFYTLEYNRLVSCVCYNRNNILVGKIIEKDVKRIFKQGQFVLMIHGAGYIDQEHQIHRVQHQFQLFFQQRAHILTPFPDAP